ncbi:peptidylprolyl isomerase [Palleronia sp. LCG004]|uniref:peptidylprolyl isomerase n=1 Tax=Palleronia sp. LCG004 TaxID=3079304 RepID=UPI002943265B|nr:peptidylprolyl isomerase [Palleronia sp. LCG004]WOI55206.1 peptidylprolyl isomerase [Palleronia sp. LCG004]
MTFRLSHLLLCALLAAPQWTFAQNLFAPAIEVDGRVVTRFEVDQRARMLELFNAPGDPREAAREALIDERLQLAEAARIGLAISEEDLLSGMEEFAARADLSREEFVAQLASQGVDETSFRDFVRAGIAWRRIVRARFGNEASRVTEADVEDEIRTPPAPGLRVLMSEIILPANNPQNAARSREIAPRIAEIDTIPAFAAAAREISASPSRDRGGQLDWLQLSELPGPLRSAISSLSPGEVTQPLSLPNAIAFFQLRAIEEVAMDAPIRSIDYAAFYIPGGRSPEALRQAAELDANVQTCDDLYGVAEGLPPSRLQRDRLPPDQIPADVAVALSQLDENEVSTALTRADGQTLVYLMLCGRYYQDEDTLEAVDRSAARDALINRRIGRRADAYLAELRANADISYP